MGMARPPRSFDSESSYHLYARGVRRQEIFLCREDCAFFLDRIKECLTEFAVRFLGYCLMPNHYHLHLQGESISHFMHRVLTAYACYFNDRYGKTGHLFERRFHAKACRNDMYAIALMRYIEMNPVRAGFVRHPREWPYCSWNELQRPAGGIVDRAAREALLGSLDDARTALDQVAARWASKALGEGPAMLAPGASRAAGVLEQIARTALVESGIRDAHRAIAKQAWAEGLSLGAIGSFLGCSKATVHRLLK